MSQSDYDPNNLPALAEEDATTLAILTSINVKLGGIANNLPLMAVNDRANVLLHTLREEVKGHIDRLRGQVIRERRAEVPD